MSFSLDLAVLAVFFVSFFVTAFRGFVKSIMTFAGTVFSFVFAKLFSNKLAMLYYSGLYDNFSGKVADAIKKAGTESHNQWLNSENIAAFLKKYNISDVVDSAVNRASDTVVCSIIAILAKVLAFLTLFLAFIVVCRIVGIIISGIFKLPVLKKLDRALSAALALCMACLYTFIFISVMQLSFPFLSAVYPSFFNQTAIDNSHIFSFLYYMEWLKIFIN